VILKKKKTPHRIKYPKMIKTFGKDFKLNIEAGYFEESEIIVLLGQNGMGKTTFVRMLAGFEKPDDEKTEIPKLTISYKPQKIAPSFNGTVRELLQGIILSALNNTQFTIEVLKPMKIDDLMNQKVCTLSGGELQRVAIVMVLGTPADLYLIDEPSTYLDCEQRLVIAKIIKRFIKSNNKTCFIVEHDFMMSTYLADRVIVYEGTPSVHATVTKPKGMETGMNNFLKQLNVTFRRDKETGRPRINKLNSQKDKEQKNSGIYFYNE